MVAPTSAIELVPADKPAPLAPSSPSSAEIPMFDTLPADSGPSLTLSPSSASTATTLAEAPEPPALSPASSFALAPSSSSSSTPPLDKLPTPPLEKPAPATGASSGGLTSTQIAGGAMVASALVIGTIAIVAARRRRRRRRNPRGRFPLVPVIVGAGVGLTTVLFLSMTLGEKNP